MTDHKSTSHPPHGALLWPLFDYLLSEMGSSIDEKDLRHDQTFKGGELFASLATAAAAVGLDFDQRLLTLQQAVTAAGNLTPLFRPLADGGWLVLSGYSRGRIKTALIHDHEIEVRLLHMPEIAAWLPEGLTGVHEWFEVSLQAPMNASSHDDHHHLTPLQRLFAMIRVEQTDLWRVVLLALAAGLLSLATPAAVQSLVNTVALGGMLQPLLVLSLMLFIFLFFYGTVSVLQSYIIELIQRRVFVRMVADLAYRLPKVQWAVYDKKNGVELVNRFFDVLTVQKSGSLLLLDGFSLALQGVIGLLVLAAYHPLLMLFDLIVIAWLIVVIFVQGRRGVSTSIQESYAKYAVVSWLETLARNGQTFKFSGGPDLARECADRLAYDYLSARKGHYRILLSQHISLYALHAVAGTALLAVGGVLVMDGQLSLGQLVAAELIVSGVLSGFSKFKKQLENYYDLMAGVDKLGHLLDLPVERETGVEEVLQGPAALHVHDLTFAYPNGYKAVAQFDFRLAPGEKVAIYAPFGAGKSTLAELIAGLRQPTHGYVEINGLDTREVCLHTLREYVALVGRLEVIEDSILENVRMGRAEISATQVREMLACVGLLEELAHLPEGLHTVLNYSGSPLSSTQLHKLLLARALIGRPGLLIIDGLVDEWNDFPHSRCREVLLDPQAPWSLLLLTSSTDVAQSCSRVIEFTQRKS